MRSSLWNGTQRGSPAARLRTGATPVCSGWHPAQTQVNTSRDSATAAGPPFKNASVPPPLHSLHSPNVSGLPFPTRASRSNSTFSKRCTKVHPFLHLKGHTLWFLFLNIPNPCTSSMLRVIRAGKRDRPPIPRRKGGRNVRVKHFYHHYAQSVQRLLKPAQVSNMV